MQGENDAIRHCDLGYIPVLKSLSPTNRDCGEFSLYASMCYLKTEGPFSPPPNLGPSGAPGDIIETWNLFTLFIDRIFVDGRVKMKWYWTGLGCQWNGLDSNQKDMQRDTQGKRQRVGFSCHKPCSVKHYQQHNMAGNRNRFLSWGLKKEPALLTVCF